VLDGPIPGIARGTTLQPRGKAGLAAAGLKTRAAAHGLFRQFSHQNRQLMRRNGNSPAIGSSRPQAKHRLALQRGARSCFLQTVDLRKTIWLPQCSLAQVPVWSSGIRATIWPKRRTLQASTTTAYVEWTGPSNKRMQLTRRGWRRVEARWSARTSWMGQGRARLAADPPCSTDTWAVRGGDWTCWRRSRTRTCWVRRTR
jgi:hypothetical protein